MMFIIIGATCVCGSGIRCCVESKTKNNTRQTLIDEHIEFTV